MFLVLMTHDKKKYYFQYLDKNMLVLKEELNEANFERVLSVIWESSALSLHNTIMLSIDVIIISC